LDVGRGASDGLRQMNENRPNLVISASDFSDLQQSSSADVQDCCILWV
jgi:hypothetical protein